MITIWGRKSSSNVQAVMWCIAELELPCQRIDAGFTYGIVDTPDYLAMNPNGTVPTIKDNDNPPLWESGAILRYLANAYAPDTFWPADPVARANVDRWAEWAKINVALNFTAPVFWRIVRTAPPKREPVAIRAAMEQLDRYLDIAETQLQRTPYLAGAELTLADIQFGHNLYRYFTIAIARRDRPALAAYYETLVQRQAFSDHVMVSYDELYATD
uniref:glutathione S-transferase family protein n=1 Tax=Pararhizobium sp. IMCC3301 TaxID=3067904 RepID=UPI0027422AF6|nr:glutathione S-transferase family protein [Pararhizobium sp. IMCC3301]